MQTFFSPASADRSPDGTKTCPRYHSASHSRTIHSICEGCKDVTYCSKECKYADCGVYRDLCAFRNAVLHLIENVDIERSISLPDSPLPSLKERTNLLDEFIEAYAWGFKKTVYSALRESGGMESFKYDAAYVEISLTFRPEYGGNPSLAFAIHTVKFQDTADLEDRPRSRAAFEAGRALREESQALLKKSSHFLGLICVIYVMEEYAIIKPMPVYAHLPAFESIAAQFKSGAWFQHFRWMIENGYVLSTRHGGVSVHGISLAFMGRIRQEGELWRWVLLTERELENEGLPSSLARGLLF